MNAGGTEGRGAGARTTIHGSQEKVVSGCSQLPITPPTMKASEVSPREKYHATHIACVDGTETMRRALF